MQTQADFTSLVPVILATGAPWPHPPLQRGVMRIEAEVCGGMLTIIMGVDMADIRHHELSAFLSAPFTCAIAARPHHVLFGLNLPPTFYDAPFEPALNGSEWYNAFLSGLHGAADSRLILVCVDAGIVRRITLVPMTKHDWAVLAAAVATCPAAHDGAAFRRSRAADERRWRPSQIMRIAKTNPRQLSSIVTVI